MSRARKQDRADRRDLIANAGITVLATAGVRGLTHRAIDRSLKLPEGSTSFYFRRRADLLDAIGAKSVRMDLADIQPVYALLKTGNASRAQVIEALAEMFILWQSAAQRVRGAARVELFLLASRDTEFAQSFGRHWKRFVAINRRLVRTLDIDHRVPFEAYRALGAGVIFKAALNDGGPEVTPAELRDAITRLFNSGTPQP